MQKISSSPVFRTSAVCMATIILLSAASTFAQNSSHSNSRAASQQNTQNREWALTHVREEVNSHFGRESKLSLPQIREDFEQLQIVNNELMKRVFVQKLADLGQIMTSVSEIKKRATRLKLNLAFGEPLESSAERNSKKPSAGPSDQQSPALPPTLLRLDKAVMSFVKNPLFQQSKLLDSKLALQAHNDIDEVLRITQILNQLTNMHSKAK